MALTPTEREIAQKMKTEGKTNSDIMGFIGGARLNRTSTVADSNPSYKKDAGIIKDSFSDLYETGKNVVGDLFGASKDIVDTFGKVKRGERSAPMAGFDVAGQVVGGLSRAAGDIVLGLAKTLFTSEQDEQNIKDGFVKMVTPIINTPEAKSIINKYNSLPDNQKQNIKTAGNFATALLDIWGLKSGRAVNTATKNAIRDAKWSVSSIFPEGSAMNSVDDVIGFADNAIKTKADDVAGKAVGQVDNIATKVDDTVKQTIPKADDVAGVRKIAEETAPKLSVKEEWIGLTPAIKKQIEGKTARTQQYIDVAIARNNDANLPSVMEYAGDNARKATDSMEEILNSTGSAIGQTRQKLATYEAGIDQVQKIENLFKKQVDALNLTITPDGRVIAKPGTVAKVTSSGDYKAIQTLWKEFQTVKESPKLTNLLDFRNLVQSHVTFGKSAREISNMLDRPTKVLREEIANVMAKVVGKSEAAKLTEYSNFMDAFMDIKNYTDKRAGGEYLLRVATSGRGGESKAIIDTIRSYTGIDLMDDAVLLSVVTELFGDASQKTLLTQALQNAGLSTVRALKGDPTVAIPVLADWLKKTFLNPEDVLIGATKKATPNPIIEAIKNPPKMKAGLSIEDVTKKGDGTIRKIAKDTNLTGEDAIIQDKAIAKYESNVERLKGQYIKDNGKVVNVDEARKYFKDVGYRGSNAAAVQEPSSALAKDVWKDLLKNSKENDSLIYAGGSGTGKTSAVKNVFPEEISDAGAILDGNLSTSKSATGRIQESIEAGKFPTIIYVYRDPMDAWVNGVIKRMKTNVSEGGRVVPLSVFVENHKGSYNVVKDLLNDVSNGVRFDVKMVDNSLGAGKQTLLNKTKFDSIKYPDDLKETLLAKTKELYEKGTIKKEEYEALIK